MGIIGYSLLYIESGLCCKSTWMWNICRLWSWKRKAVIPFAAILGRKSGAIWDGELLRVIIGALRQTFLYCEYKVDCAVDLKLQVDEYFLLKNTNYKSGLFYAQ